VTRVAFFSQHGFHGAILRPIADALDGRVVTLITSRRRDVVDFQPQILVLASHSGLRWFRNRLPETRIGSVRHGLIAKRVLQRLAEVDAVRRLDFLCTSDADTIERYRTMGAEPTEIWRTGYPQLDPLFRHDPPPPLGLDAALPVVLYAPTWNLRLSSAPLLAERIAELIRGDGPRLGLIIKPHPTMAEWRPDWIAWWRELATRDEQVRLADAREDISPLMLASDLLISDASSTIFQFLALDRPIVLITNPEATSDPDYDPADLPWAWRDVGAEVRGVAALAETVAAELADPGARSERRAARADALFGEFRDGGNVERIADRVLDLAARIEAGTAPAPISLPQGSQPVRRSRGQRSLASRTARSVRRRVLGHAPAGARRAAALRDPKA
jgi:hypothetical protein